MFVRFCDEQSFFVTGYRINDPAMQAAVELQIKEFGQTPKQLFLQPHPARRKAKIIHPPADTVRSGGTIGHAVCS